MGENAGENVGEIVGEYTVEIPCAVLGSGAGTCGEAHDCHCLTGPGKETAAASLDYWGDAYH